MDQNSDLVLACRDKQSSRKVPEVDRPPFGVLRDGLAPLLPVTAQESAMGFSSFYRNVTKCVKEDFSR